MDVWKRMLRNLKNARETSFESLQQFLFWKSIRSPVEFLFLAGFRQDKHIDWVSGNEAGPSTSLLNLSEILMARCNQH